MLSLVFTASILVEAATAAGSIYDIEHVIIFMQENRAFDHYFGTMKGVRGYNDRTPLPLPSGRNSFYQPVDQSDLSQYMLPWHVDASSTSAMCMDAPQMGYEVDVAMWNNGLFDSWNTAREPGTGMSYFTRADLPYYYTLYDNFAVGDQYFQSAFTATNPNRLFFFSGSNGLSAATPDSDDGDAAASAATNSTAARLLGGDDHGDADDDIDGHNQCVLDNTEPRPGFNWTTVAEQLESANISWKVYQEIDNFDDNGFAWFYNFQKSRSGDPLHDKGMKRYGSMVHALKKDMDEGTLPSVSWLIAPTGLSEHASHHPAAGEALTSRVLDVLREHPDVYAKTAFILNYDEGGQFYDHHWSPTPPINAESAPPSTKASAEEASLVTVKEAGEEEDHSGGEATMGVWGEVNTDVKTTVPAPIGMGFRVPLLIISPWTRGNLVVSETFDHTSVIQFLEERFDFECPNISPWRRAVTGNLLSAFDFDSEPDVSWPELPSTAGYIIESFEDCKLPYPERPAEQSFPEQEPGTRIARALGYAFEVTDRVDAQGVLSVTITNTGTSGAAFTLYDKLTLADVAAGSAPPASAVKQYAVDGLKKAGETPLSVTATLPAAHTGALAHDFVLLGPNGFTRQFTATPDEGSSSQCADSTAGISTKITYNTADADASTHSVTLSVTNANTNPVSFTLNENAYTAYYKLSGQSDVASFTVAPGETLEHTMVTAAAGNWYDFKLSTSENALCFSRRYAGHMENGRDSISDPAMGFKSPDSLQNEQHPEVPLKYRKLIKSAGGSLHTAMHKDAVWFFDGVGAGELAAAANEEL